MTLHLETFELPSFRDAPKETLTCVTKEWRPSAKAGTLADQMSVTAAFLEVCW